MALVGLGVSGGIGAYKAVEVARRLQKGGHRVRVVMTRSARKFVGPLTFESITREPVITGQFSPGMNADIEHIAFASDIDLLLVAPGTANIIGKFANGIADDFLSTLFLATKAPVLLAPAMNTHMWEHPTVRANVERLAAHGVYFVDPSEGYLACGWIGKGRLAEPEDIVAAAGRLLDRSESLAGRRVIVTAGPTYEDLDPVRFVGNRSSGRMGFALAAEAERRGAEVTLVAGPTAVAPPAVAQLVRVRTAAEMHAAVLPRAESADVVIMAAAVADYTPAGGPAAAKFEKGDGLMTLRLEQTADILADLGTWRGASERPLLVGFAAQTGDVVEPARRKLIEKRVDLVVGNNVSESDAGFDVETNRVTLVTAEASEALPVLSKTAVASEIFDRVERLLITLSPVPTSR